MSEHSALFHKDTSKSRQRFKEALGKSRQFETICLNKSQLKHMHAIRPYSSKERKSSRRDSRHNQSPHELSRSKSKRLDNSSKKNDDPPLHFGGKQLTEMYGELISLKSQYKMLKTSYNKLLIDKKQALKKEEEEKIKIAEQLEQSQIEVERLKRNNSVLEKEIDRIKKQCIKIVEMERFKIKKLEQTLQEKELMIAFLRNSLEQLKKGQNSENQASLFFMQNSLPLSFDYFSKQPNISNLSRISSEFQTHKGYKNGAIVEEDSLSFSRDKSKEADSIIHSFLSQDHSILNHNFTKKENILINSLNQSPITQQIEIIDETSEKSQKSMSNPQSSQFQAERYSIHSQEHQCKHSVENKPQLIHLQQKVVGIKNKAFTKRLQIHVTDENVDMHNVGEELSMETKKKTVGSGFACRQKKKQTAKKPKQI